MAEPDLDRLNFYTGVNYMKRSDTSGHVAKSVAGSGGQEVITHALGYIPHFDVYMDVNNDGTIWYGGFIVDEDTESTSGGASPDYLALEAYMTTTALTLNIVDLTSGGITSSPELYWLIYLDYGV